MGTTHSSQEQSSIPSRQSRQRNSNNSMNNSIDVEQDLHQTDAATVGPPPASTSTLNALVTLTLDRKNNFKYDECQICYEKYDFDQVVTSLPCGHIFHHQCIVQWLCQHCTCPRCRYELPTDDFNYETGRVQRMRTRKVAEIKGRRRKKINENLESKMKIDSVDSGGRTSATARSELRYEKDGSFSCMFSVESEKWWLRDY